MAKPYQVHVTDYLSEARVELEVLQPLAEVRLLRATRPQEILPAARTADVLLVYHTMRITSDVAAQLERCRLIVRVGVGFDNVDLQAAGERGIVVCNVPDYGTEEVADHALMLLIAVARRLIASHNGIIAGGWTREWTFGAPRLRGKTLGLIGCGRIGSAMALRARAVGMRVLAYDPYQPHGLDKALGIERCLTLEELLPQAQFLSLHCPLTQETRHILNRGTLAQLPRGAYVINTARGPCIDQAALLDALDQGQVAYAALDVVEREPLDDERLRRHPRVLLTPHAAYYSEEGFVEMRRKSALEAERCLKEQPVLNPVNAHFVKHPRCPLPRSALGDLRISVTGA